MRVEDGFPMSEALYRKYRPQIFEDVVGQEHIERTIKNAIGQDKVSHAYLFTGPRGTGKTTTARLLAKALLCEKGPTAEPDGTCNDCVAIANGEHPDVYELDAASRTGVENVREEIIGRVQFAPTRGRYKVYIIDEVHMLSTAAFNALLKTLEEPPSHVVFILCTTDPQKVPETIHSRCQRFDFRRISAEAIVSRLGAVCVAEGVEFEGEALDLIAHRAEGGMRNALTSLEQLIAFGEGKVTMEVAERLLGSLDSSDLAAIVRAIGTRDVASCFRWTAEYVETGADLAQFVRDLAEHIRNMYVLALAGDDVALEVGESVRRELADELAAVRSRPSGPHARRVGRRVGGAEDVHEPAPVLRDRAHAHGAARFRPDAGIARQNGWRRWKPVIPPWRTSCPPQRRRARRARRLAGLPRRRRKSPAAGPRPRRGRPQRAARPIRPVGLRKVPPHLRGLLPAGWSLPRRRQRPRPEPLRFRARMKRRLPVPPRPLREAPPLRLPPPLRRLPPQRATPLRGACLTTCRTLPRCSASGRRR